MEILGFHHLAIRVDDVETVARFYTETLGLPEVSRHLFPDGALRSVWVGTRSPGGTNMGFLAIEKLDDPAMSLGQNMVALRISKPGKEALLVELKRKGVPVIKTSRWTVYVRDPENNVVGFSHHPHD